MKVDLRKKSSEYVTGTELGTDIGLLWDSIQSFGISCTVRVFFFVD
jgi:hypothetical protein